MQVNLLNQKQLTHNESFQLEMEFKRKYLSVVERMSAILEASTKSRLTEADKQLYFDLQVEEEFYLCQLSRFNFASGLYCNN